MSQGMYLSPTLRQNVDFVFFSNNDNYFRDKKMYDTFFCDVSYDDGD